MDFSKIVTLLAVVAVFAFVDGQFDAKACTEELGFCSKSEECCPEQGCQNGACLNCTRSGNVCTNNTKCCECTTERCIDTICQKCSIRGIPCSSDNACCGSPKDECRNNKCSQCTQRGEKCKSRGPCCRGTYCCNDICLQCLSVGSVCTTDEACCSGTGCISGICADCALKCSTDLDCPCTETACLKETCRKCNVLGETCSSDSNCCHVSPNCRAGKCEPCADADQPCSSHRGCCRPRGENTYCVNRQCKTLNGTVAVPCSQTVELMILVDGSWSVGIDGFNQAKEFVANLIEGFHGRQQSRIGVIVFASNAAVIISMNNAFGLAESKRLIRAAPWPPSVDKFDSVAETALAIKGAIAELTKYTKGFQKKLLYITYNKSKTPNSTVLAADDAKRQGIVGYSVGIGFDIDRPELVAVAGASAARVRVVRDSAALGNAVSSVSVLVCDK